MKFSKIWVEQCEAARTIEDKYGAHQALDYLIGDKFINFLEASDEHRELRAEIPAFVAEIKMIFDRFQLSEYLKIARQTPPFDPSVFDDPEQAELEAKAELRRSAADLLLVERARNWLLEE